MSVFSLPCPPTPVMLYIGAGYDLSPLLSFAPGGPPYPIVPLSAQDDAHTHAICASPDKFTSFLFVDAKPRFTSAYMVSDFHEWTSIEARVRNVLHYAQGSLSRWRTVPGAPDLLWFEGGGDPALIDSRTRDPAWIFHDPFLPDPPVSYDSAGEPSSPKPLTTLLYLFNTLDVELVRAPLLEHVWPRVEALYVHGLRLHVHTGAGTVLGRHATPNALVSGVTSNIRSSPRVHRPTAAEASLQTQLGTRLKRCYVIVGSWGTPLRKPRSTGYKGNRTKEAETVNMGVRHVDFVSEAWRRWRGEAGSCRGHRSSATGSCPPLSSTPSSSSPSPPLPSTPSSASPTRLSAATSTSLDLKHNVPPASPITFRRPRVRESVLLHQDCHPDDAWDSDYHGDSSEDLCTDWNESEYEYPHEQPDGGGGRVKSMLPSSPRISGPFHMRIPQLAWSSTLRGGRGGYFVEKTVEESLASWRARQGSYAGDSEEDESASEGEFTYEEDKKSNEMMQKKKSIQYLYILRSLFSIRAHTPPTSSALAHSYRRTSSTPIISRSRKPPPRSRPKLRPRLPTPAPDSEESESEISASETVVGAGRCRGNGMGEVWECGCQRRGGRCGVTYEMGMGSEKESVAFGFGRRGVRARRGVEDLNGRVGVRDMPGVAKARTRTMSMSHTDGDVPIIDNKAVKTPTHIASRHSRNPSSKSLDIPLHTSKSPSAIPGRLKPRERRINIADFLSTTGDSNAVAGLSSTDAIIPTAISDSGPVMFSSDTARAPRALESAQAISGIYPTPVPTPLRSFSSPSLSPASLPTIFPRSPYGPSDLFDNDIIEQQTPSATSNKKRRPLTLPFLRNATKQQQQQQQREKEYRSTRNTHISRAGSISELFWWKPPPVARRGRDGSPPSSSPSSRTSTRKSLPAGHPHKDAAGVRAHSHSRALASARRFRFQADTPPTPALASRFRGYTLFEPRMHWDTDRSCSHTGTRAEARASSDALSGPRVPSVVTGDLLDGGGIILERQSADSDETRVGC